jgi:hypothetical protein
MLRFYLHIFRFWFTTHEGRVNGKNLPVEYFRHLAGARTGYRRVSSDGRRYWRGSFNRRRRG